MSTHVGIVKTPDILHGKPRFEGTRIGVFMIAEGIRAGDWTTEETLNEFPDLSRAQVEAGLDYYDEHPEAMDVIRTQNEANRHRIREQSRAPNAPASSDDRKQA